MRLVDDRDFSNAVTMFQKRKLRRRRSSNGRIDYDAYDDEILLTPSHQKINRVVWLIMIITSLSTSCSGFSIPYILAPFHISIQSAKRQRAAEGIPVLTDAKRKYRNDHCRCATTAIYALPKGQQKQESLLSSADDEHAERDEGMHPEQLQLQQKGKPPDNETQSSSAVMEVGDCAASVDEDVEAPNKRENETRNTSDRGAGDCQIIIHSVQEQSTVLSSMSEASDEGDTDDTDSEKDLSDRSLARQMRVGASKILSRPIVEIFSSALVLSSSMLVAISTLDDLPFYIIDPVIVAQDVIAATFLAEFILRWIASSNISPVKYISQPLVLVDLAVVVLPFFVTLASNTEFGRSLPLWLVSNNALINLRLLRIVRLQRVLQDLDTFANFEKALGIKTEIKEWQLQLARVVLSIFTLLSVATGLIYTAEHRVNPAIKDYFDALYFGLTTLTTVGFGDITPITPQGKLVVSLSILAGVAVVPAQGAALVEALLERQRQKDKKKKDKLAESKNSKQTKQVGDNGELVDLRRGNDNNKNNAGRMTLETSFACPSCGASMHWSNANYCWSCGYELSTTPTMLPDAELSLTSQQGSKTELSEKDS